MPSIPNLLKPDAIPYGGRIIVNVTPGITPIPAGFNLWDVRFYFTVEKRETLPFNSLIPSLQGVRVNLNQSTGIMSVTLQETETILLKDSSNSPLSVVYLGVWRYAPERTQLGVFKIPVSVVPVNE